MKTICMAAILVLITCTAIWAEDHSHHAPPAPQGSGQYAEFVKTMNTDMDKMMNDMHKPGYSGDPDIDFLAMMIPHHQGAIDMARLQLIYGKDPLIRALAEEIIAAQQVEIEAMKRRLQLLRSRRPDQAPDYPALNGTRGDGSSDNIAPASKEQRNSN